MCVLACVHVCLENGRFERIKMGNDGLNGW